MKINKENYPVYFLDFHEGRLSEADKAVLFDFLSLHPELQEEFESFEPLSISWDGQAIFSGRESLKRGEVNPANYGYYFAAYAEGDLGAEERAAVEAYAATSPSLQRELMLMQKVFLPAETVEFPGKAMLKMHVITPVVASVTSAGAAGVPAGEAQPEPAGRETIIPLFLKRWMPYVSAAAVVMLLAGLFFLRLPDRTPADYSYAWQTPVVGGTDDPEAVADATPDRQEGGTGMPGEAGFLDPDRETVATRNGDAGTRQPGGETLSTRDRETGNMQPGRETAGALYGEAGIAPPGSDTGTSHGEAGHGKEPVARAYPGTISLLASSLPIPVPVDGRQNIATLAAHSAQHPESMSHRTEFAFWSPSSLPGESFFGEAQSPEEYPAGYREMSLFQLAVNRIGQALPAGQEDAYDRDRRSPLLYLAEAGLRGLGSVVTSTLGIERITDEEGRTVGLTAGEGFEARRSKR